MSVHEKAVGAMPRCNHGVTIGSYPGEGYAICDLPPGHDDDHEGTYTWEQKWPECGDCPAPVWNEQ